MEDLDRSVTCWTNRCEALPLVGSQKRWMSSVQAEFNVVDVRASTSSPAGDDVASSASVVRASVSAWKENGVIWGTRSSMLAVASLY